MGATTTNRRRASSIAAALIGLGLILGGTLASGANAAGQPTGGPAINRTLFGGVARDFSIQELTAINRARGIAFPSR